MVDTFLLLGSNMGDRLSKLHDAEFYIGTDIGRIESKSSIYESEPWGFNAQISFYNRVLKVDVDIEARELLNRCQLIEQKMGRVRGSDYYESREIDIDILLFGNEILENNDLIIPHPKMHLRRFTLEPLNELLPDYTHPKLKISISELLQDCEDSCWTKKL